MTDISSPENRPTPWSFAVQLLARWLELNVRVDVLLEDLPRSLMGAERGRCQSLLFGAVRHLRRIDNHLDRLVARPPRPRLKAVLLVAGYEFLEGGDEHHVARVVHHAVGQTKTLASEPEARLVNAVLRKLAPLLAADVVPGTLATAEQLGIYFSHPDWLVERWLAQFGAAATRQLLEWNQKPSSVYARWRLSDRPPAAEELEWLGPTSWPGFFELKPGHWPAVEAALAAGKIYLQDPSTRYAIELLDPRLGETVLDLCAAPGGKSLAMADTLRAAAIVAGSAGSGPAGRIVALDLPGERIDRLKENLNRAEGVDVALVQGDAEKAGARLFKENSLPVEYSAVLIDVPCSNTGVMRHRVDVKWRMRLQDFAQHAGQQGELLRAASRLVSPGGRLVYSTCSLDAEENEGVVAAFVGKTGGRFVLEKSVLSRPWETGHDGAAAFLLRRIG